jgi:nicotinate-nucleotide adenylyltransferase
VIVAFFGGSFNPPHIAHVMAVTVVLATHDVDRVLVVPTYKHPFAKALAPYDDRVKMCELAMGWLPRTEVSRVEEELGGESRTLRTIEHLAAAHADWKLRLVIGADIVADVPRWFGFDEIARIAPPIVLGRAGVTGPNAPPPLLPDVSSTDVREMIARGEWSALEPLMPRAVFEHVRSRGLYASA